MMALPSLLLVGCCRRSLSGYRPTLYGDGDTFLCCQDRHDLVGETSSAKKIGHDLHRPVDMCEERLVCGAKVIEPRLPVGRPDKTVLGALAMACKSHFALPACARQSITLVPAEFDLLR